MVSSKYFSIVNCCNNPSDLALYTEMKEGMLAPETDYASRPLRDHLKRKEKYIFVNFFILYYVSQRVLRKQIKCFYQFSRMPPRPKNYAQPSVYLKDPSFFLICQALSSNQLKRYDPFFKFFFL